MGQALVVVSPPTSPRGGNEASITITTTPATPGDKSHELSTASESEKRVGAEMKAIMAGEGYQWMSLGGRIALSSLDFGPSNAQRSTNEAGKNSGPLPQPVEQHIRNEAPLPPSVPIPQQEQQPCSDAPTSSPSLTQSRETSPKPPSDQQQTANNVPTELEEKKARRLAMKNESQRRIRVQKRLENLGHLPDESQKKRLRAHKLVEELGGLVAWRPMWVAERGSGS